MAMLRFLPLAAISALLTAIGGQSAIAISPLTGQRAMGKSGLFSFDTSARELVVAQATDASDLDTVEVEAPESLEGTIEQPGISLEEEAAIDSASVDTERCSDQLNTGRGVIDAAGIPVEGAAVPEPNRDKPCELSVTEKTQLEEAQAEEAEMDVSE